MADVWTVTGADPFYTGELVVTDEGATVPRQQESFEVLGRNRKVLMTGMSTGHEGTLSVVWLQEDAATALILLDYLANNRGPHLLENPFGESFYVEFGPQTRKWLSGGHLQVDLNWIEIGVGNTLTYLFLDNFGRIEPAGTIGPADIPTNTWSPSNSGTFSVSGSVLVWTADASFGAGSALINAGSWATGSQDFTMRVKFAASISGTFTGGEYNGFGIEVGDSGTGNGPGLEVVQEATEKHLMVYSDFNSDSTPFTMVDGTEYILIWQHRPSVNISHAKVYAVGDTDPGWMVSRATSSDAAQSQTNIELFPSGKTTTVSQWRFDYINVI